MRLRRHPGQPSTEELLERLDRIAALVYALFHDVAAWLSATDGPVDPTVFPGYRLSAVARLSSPRERMRLYASPAVLDAWAPVLDGWCGAGYGYRPAYGRTLRLAVTELPSEGPRAVVSFQDRSEVELPGGTRRQPGNHWTLSVSMTADAQRISGAMLRDAAFDP